MNKSTFMLFGVVILVWQCCCGLTVVDQTRIGQSGANAGTFTGIATPIISDDILYDSYAADNTARTRGDVANAGNRFFTGGDVDISDSYVGIYDTSYDNFARSRRNTAVSGSQTVIANISDSLVVKDTVADKNIARITRNPNTPVPQAIAGSQTQVLSLENSTFAQVQNKAVDNIAENFAGGNAIAGTETSFGKITNSTVYSNDYAGYNDAYNYDGPATSGVVFGAGSVQNSNVSLFTTSFKNKAFAIGAPAVAGVEQSFGSVNDSTIDIDVDTIGNYAVAYNNGKAVSGLVSAFESVENSTVDIDVNSYGNYAVTYGESDTEKDAVAGVSVTVNSLDNSKLNITADTGYNYAINKNYVSATNNENDAISGVDIVVGQGKDSEVHVDLSSKNNGAYAVYGDAVAGNRVTVLNNENTTVTYNGNYVAGSYGDSIFGSFVGK